MNIYLIGVVILQTTAAASAVFLNGFLIFVIVNFTKNNLGFYKSILITFSVFEIVYALVACIGMPVHYITKGTFIGMTFLGPLVGTHFHKYGPTFYCLFYEIWLGFIMFNFIYRYVIVCRPEWVSTVKNSSLVKGILTAGVCCYLVVTGICSHYLCTANRISPEVLHEVLDHFDLENNTAVSYYATRMTNLDGSYSPQSIMALGMHYFYAYGSLAIIGTCSWKIYKNIQRQIKIAQTDLNLALERQLFLSLVIQALIPIVMTNIPSFYILLYPILPDNFIIALLTPLFSLSVTFPKALDPIITIVCIKEYKVAVSRFLGIGCGGRGNVDQSQVYSSVGSFSAP